MGSRLDLHEELCVILGTREVYFQPPSSVKMKYPCIRYSMKAPNLERANNRIYKNTNRYEVIVIDQDPDSTIADTIQDHFDYATIDRRYTADNLNHTAITIYY